MGLGDSRRNAFLERFAAEMVGQTKDKKIISKPAMITTPPLSSVVGGAAPPAMIDVGYGMEVPAGWDPGVLVLDDPVMTWGPGASIATGAHVVGLDSSGSFYGFSEGKPIFLGPGASIDAATKLAIRKLAIGDDNEIDPEDFGMTIGALISEYRDIFVVDLEMIAPNTQLRDPISRTILTWEKLRERFG